MKRKQAIGFYSKGKGKRRKVIPITRSSGRKRSGTFKIKAGKVTSQQSLIQYKQPPKHYDVEAQTPSLATLRNIESTFPKNLTDAQLVKKYGQLKSTKRDYINGNLSNSYFRGIADSGGVTGKVPKDAYAISNNLDYSINEYEQEIKKRNLKYSLTLLSPKRKKSTKAKIKKVRCECGLWFNPREIVRHSYSCSKFHKKWGSQIISAR